MRNFSIDDDAIVILNKSDLLSDLGDVAKNFIAFSVKNSHNLDRLLSKIQSIVEDKCSVASDAIVTTHQRQKEKLLDVLFYLRSIDLMEPLEMTAEKVRSAVASIEYITGKITLDDILDKIFSSFCIGK